MEGGDTCTGGGVMEGWRHMHGRVCDGGVATHAREGV